MPAQLTSDARSLWEQVQNTQPSAGKCLVDIYAVVEAVFEVRDLAALESLRGQHILSANTSEQRFHYRQPGLFVLTVRTYRVPVANEVVDTPYIAGCKSWVELPAPFSTAGAKPVLEEAVFGERLQLVNAVLNRHA